jgi:hypothetical protein
MPIFQNTLFHFHRPVDTYRHWWITQKKAYNKIMLLILAASQNGIIISTSSGCVHSGTYAWASSIIIVIIMLVMYRRGAHMLTTVMHLCINISQCSCNTVRRQQVQAVQHHRHAESREWWTSLFAENIWHTSVCSVACKDGQLRDSLPLYAPVPNAVFCIIHGNIRENIRFLMMGTVTALAFTVYSHTLLDA